MGVLLFRCKGEGPTGGPGKGAEMARQKSAERMQALGYILGGGLSYSWFDVEELDDSAVSARVKVMVEEAGDDGDPVWEEKSVSADDVARGLRMYREWLEGKREGYPGEWKWAAENLIRAGKIASAEEFDPLKHARADAGSYGWQMVKFDRSNGNEGDYDANSADSVMQFALLGHNIYG
jgi:hypothetical protein